MKYLTAGESHGKALVGIIEGFPANVPLDFDQINHELARRQQGYGRGNRMKIETDKAVVLSGVRNYLTMGSPISFMIENKDFAAWEKIFSPQACDISKRVVTDVRPGHADYAGAIKFDQQDARNILERASARQTATRVAIGAFCKQFLSQLGVRIGSHVTNIGGQVSRFYANNADELIENADKSVVRCMDKEAETNMLIAIDEAIAEGDTLGGEVEIVVSGMKIGIGSHTEYYNKLDYMLCGQLMSIQSVKSVAVGIGADAANVPGSECHDTFLNIDELIKSAERANSDAVRSAERANSDAVRSAEIVNSDAVRSAERANSDAAKEAKIVNSDAVKSAELANTSAEINTATALMRQACADRSSAITRGSNNAGGIEGGISNGQNLILRIAAKPIPTVMKGLPTINLITKQNTTSSTERSDYCAIPALGVVAENVVAAVLMEAILVKTGGDYLAEILERWNKL